MSNIALSSKFVMKSIIVFILDLIFLYMFFFAVALLLESSLNNNCSGEILMMAYFTIWGLYYFVLFRKTGQTLAMRIFNLKVRNSNDDKPDFLIALAWLGFMTNPVTAIGLCLYVISIAEYKMSNT